MLRAALELYRSGGRSVGSEFDPSGLRGLRVPEVLKTHRAFLAMKLGFECHWLEYTAEYGNVSKEKYLQTFENHMRWIRESFSSSLYVQRSGRSSRNRSASSIPTMIPSPALRSFMKTSRMYVAETASLVTTEPKKNCDSCGNSAREEQREERNN